MIHVQDYIYLFVLFWVCLCLGYGHHSGKVDLWSTITTTKDGKVFTDSKKLAYLGAFVVMTATFAFLAISDKLTEWYATIYVATWVVGKYLGDREQRLNKEKGAAQ